MIKVGTIGSGVIVDRMIEAIKQVNGIELEVVYSRSEEKAKEFSVKHGAEKYYWDLDEMLNDPAIDTIYIASPNSLHYAQAKKALENKKNVILEKPFTTTYQQAQELFDLADKNGVYIMEAITNVHTPNFKAIQNHLPQIGDVKVVECNFSQYSSRYAQYKKHEMTNAFDTAFDGGALRDINVYNLHFITGLFGKPISLTYKSNIGYNGIDTSGILILEYPTFMALAIGSKDSSSPYNALIQGDEGTIRVDQASTGVCAHAEILSPIGDTIGKKDLKSIQKEISEDQGFHMYYEVADFVDMVLNKNQKKYDQYKDQTLLVAALLEEAQKQRDKKANELAGKS